MEEEKEIMEKDEDIEKDIDDTDKDIGIDEDEEEQEEEKIIEDKRYSIPYEMFGNAYTTFQKKYVYPRNIVMCAILIAAAIANVLVIVLGGKSGVLSYVLVMACLALAAINIYNPMKIKKRLMEQIKGIENDVYTLEIFHNRLVVGTVLDPAETRERETEEYEEVFDTAEELEEIEKSDIYVNSTLRVTERADYFLVYIKKSMFYVVPKSAFTDDEIKDFANYFNERIGKYFSCEADR